MSSPELLDLWADPIAEMARKRFGLADDWRYKDFPRMRREFWLDLLSILGEDNIKLLTYADYGKDMVRGSMMISPHGFENVAAYNASKTA